MAIARTTIMASEKLIARMNERIKETGETQTEFFNRAILNQLENDGDFEIRDIMEEEINAHKNTAK